MTLNQELLPLAAVIYRVVLMIMIALLLAAGAISVVTGNNDHRIATKLIELYLYAIPGALLAIGIGATLRRSFLPAIMALGLFMIWGVFKMVG